MFQEEIMFLDTCSSVMWSDLHFQNVQTLYIVLK